MSGVLPDFRLGLRMLGKAPGSTTLAMIALALGIGATTVIFSVVNAVLLRPLPYYEVNRLVVLWTTFDPPRGGAFLQWLSLPRFNSINDDAHVFEQVGAYALQNFNVSGTDEPEMVLGARVTSSFFRVLGIEPVAGRVILPEEDEPGANEVALISDRLWRDRFGGDRSQIGRTISVDGHGVTLVGVMPASFDFPHHAEIWVPKVDESAIRTRDQTARGAMFLGVVGRLKPGMVLANARSEVASIDDRYRERFSGNTDVDGKTVVVSLTDQTVGNFRPALLIILCSVGLVMLIACANVSNLLLARTASRQSEIALRACLGASTARLVRQFLIESLLLALLGGGVGVLLALVGVDFLVRWGPANIPRIRDVAVDPLVLGFGLSLSILTGLVVGLVPGLRSSKASLAEMLKEGDRRQSLGKKGGRLQNALVVGEVALALLLSIGAVLLIKSFANLQRVNLGFNYQKVLTFQISLGKVDYAEAHRQSGFFEDLTHRLQSLPSVESVGISSFLPLGGGGVLFDYVAEGSLDLGQSKNPLAWLSIISPDYFRTMQIRLLRGRFFTDTDLVSSQRVAIINRTMAESRFAGNPLGKHLVYSKARGGIDVAIIGVVEDVHFREDVEPGDQMYVPLAQRAASAMTTFIRTSRDPETLMSAVRKEVRTMDRALPVYQVRSMEEVVSEAHSQPRLRTVLLGAFSLLALLLAMLGLYSVTSHAVTLRTHETAVRMALGATGTKVVLLVVRQAVTLTLAGVAIGTPAALALTRLMSGLLFGVSKTDLGTFIVVPLLLIVVSLLASYLPASKATRVDPMISLRSG
jgi:putative ABC transport system permease protein